jgi:hypothetical protein
VICVEESEWGPLRVQRVFLNVGEADGISRCALVTIMRDGIELPDGRIEGKVMATGSVDDAAAHAAMLELVPYCDVRVGDTVHKGYYGYRTLKDLE